MVTSKPTAESRFHILSIETNVVRLGNQEQMVNIVEWMHNNSHPLQLG